jgi:transcription factor C subunit 3
MRDLEIDMLDDGAEDEAANELEEDSRIPPQWTPDRLLANVIYEFTALAGVVGWDALVLRDRVVGPFWRRPMESQLTRLTDDWERMQPPHIRHLAIVRDTRNTAEKRFIHYVYRTYKHFQQAVNAGEALWEGVSRPTPKADGKHGRAKNLSRDNLALDSWGLSTINQKDFIRFNGTATLSDVRSAIVGPRKYGPRWDHALAKEIGHRKPETPMPKMKERRPANRGSTDITSNQDEEDPEDQRETTPLPKKPNNVNKAKKKGSGLMLTPDERIALGLKPTGRLSKSAAQQILAHRRETGDPTSLPETIVEEPANRGRAPLMTKAERLAEKLPVKGRLGLDKENEIREKRGLSKLVAKPRKKPAKKEVAILTKQQRVALGLKGHGRLHQHFVDALRREQDNDIPLEKSLAVEAYREFLKAEAAKAASRKARESASARISPAEELRLRPRNELEQADGLRTSSSEGYISRPLPRIGMEKRKAVGDDVSTADAKRQRTNAQVSQAGAVVTPRHGRPQDEVTTTLQTESSANDSSGDAIVPDVEESYASTDDTSKVVAAEASFSESHLRGWNVENGELCHETPRYSPGLYVYPSAKGKGARGRPRNAFIAVFSSSRLVEMPWFEHSTTTVFQVSSMGALRSAGLGLKTQAKARDENILCLDTAMPSPSSDVSVNCATPGLSRRDYRPENLVSLQHGAHDAPQATALHLGPGANYGSAPTSVVLQEPPREYTDIMSNNTARNDGTFVVSKQPPVLTKEPGGSGIRSPVRAVAGSTAFMAPAQAAAAYQSPYAPEAHRTSMTPTEATHNAIATNHSSSGNSNPSGETESTTTLPHGVVGAIADCLSVATTKKTAGRSSGPSITGSGLRFRREIIQEIIDRCGGVFPLHGEIWRPFSALWDQRHGHTSMKKPESTTVFATLQNMIINPAFGLKRMAFLVKARNAAGARERVMVTRADMTPHDPKVRRLAYHMANDALDKSRQYFPEEIRDAFEFDTLYVPVPVAPKVDSITLEHLGISIQENAARRRREKNEQKKREKEAAKKQNEQVEQALPRRRARASGASNHVVPRAKRARLASLNDKNKRYRRAAVKTPGLRPVEEEEQPGAAAIREPSPAISNSSEDIPLISLRPLLSDIVEYGSDDDEPRSLDGKEDDDELVLEREQEEKATGDISLSLLDTNAVSFTHPVIRFEPFTGTYSTFFSIVTALVEDTITVPATSSLRLSKLKKRVRIDVGTNLPPRKKIRSSHTSRKEALDDEFLYSSVDDSDATSSEDEEEEVRRKGKPSKRKLATTKRKLSKKLSPPTLLERLTGLTGDPNDPIYNDPRQRHKSGYGRPWAERKKKQLNKQRKEREYAEALDQADEFKKMFYTLALASSMSGEAGRIEWAIVEKVYARDKFFDLPKVKRLWGWMRVHMATQVAKVIASLQSNMLTAYEAGRLPAIEDPEVYDWAGLTRWTMRTCSYPEDSLPARRTALDQFAIDESAYTTLDRAHWYGKKVADTTRTQLQLQTSFVAPLHQPRNHASSMTTNELKARSWIRANIATPQVQYDSNKAHEKLKVLGEDILTKVVANYVQQEHLKLRKIKRQLPGRNYTFTKKFAKTYKRPFELEDFMVATTVKKELDTAFSVEDPDKRFYSISRCEEDGAIMAITSLVGDGKVKLIPRLPPVVNEFGAPLPRLSRWGFCEGDYIHRAIDRNRMFWDVYAVPTSTYQFGNPLQSLSSPSADWPSLPGPPLPGNDDAGALLPIWSSIHGQTVTWPWWYRILNLVLQPLLVQPGATASDIHNHCSKHATELFEIELVLDWLEAVGAVTKVVGGGYQVTCSFWASFGDRLHDTADDWFGEHVKRRTKSTSKQQWRDKYNLRYSTMQEHGSQRAQADSEGIIHKDDVPQVVGAAVSRRIFQNSKAQYRIVQQALLEPALETTHDTTEARRLDAPEHLQEHALESVERSMAGCHTETESENRPHPTEGVNTLDQDVAMVEVDAELDAEGEDMDAEGDVDVDIDNAIP